MKNTEVCGNCSFFVSHEGQFTTNEFGECHRYAPGPFYYQWATVARTNGCGDFIPFVVDKDYNGEQ